ncbi:MAG: nitroreductase family protein [Burkholderiaceae bacterium]
MTQARQTEWPIDDLFTRRWSPRAFTGERIDDPTLLGLFEAARWAPSAYNAQPWRFIYARPDGPGWSSIFDALVEFNRGWAQRASALVVVLSRTQWIPPGKQAPESIPTHSFDTGAAWASLAFQATLAGWYTHGMAGFDRERLRAAFEIPGDFAIEAVIAVGRQGDAAILSEGLRAREAPNARLPLGTIVAEGRFAFES